MPEQQVPKLSIVLMSPQLSKLHAAAIMASTAAAAGMRVQVFATMDALGQFRKEVVERRAFVLDEVGRELVAKGVPLFYDLLAQGKEVGDLHVFGCAMAADLMGWRQPDFIDLVEDVIGVTAFFGKSEGAQILTI
ncbi:DsrE/DsrF/DrsH-like family protein [Carboxydochorda subterranea]|uniref:DsrE/DsrF/DrsH-like family protein n=1 Tax=Carboxydichorda subterranea TaxID=3109565 RepID=A0ABZ1C1K5_9FIRM|nr:DsrE/DsrF/DrsH-like family protein [Limnochorda sp. L945t]WRP18969.1 DsrE/DsrF/DrsH-like family protein [Limnochorda sp. L945t]